MKKNYENDILKYALFLCSLTCCDYIYNCYEADLKRNLRR